jgi:hypothetical protein
MINEITLRIKLLQPPAGVDFGLQKGSGSNYETVQKQRSAGQDLSFVFSVRFKSAETSPNFLGEFVQGPSSNRFIYLDIGTYAGQTNTPWSRRLKIPLAGITNQTLQKAITESIILEATVKGTGKDGGPSCGTIKPFDGWHLVRK